MAGGSDIMPALDVHALAEVASAAAGLGTFAIAALALLVGARQLGTAREMEALNAYEKYHHLTLDHPDLAAGNFDITAASQDERRRYVTYVLSMLLTLERVMVLFPRDRKWRAAFEDDLLPHQRFLCAEEFLWHRESLSPLVERFIARTAQKHGWTYPHVADRTDRPSHAEIHAHELTSDRAV